MSVYKPFTPSNYSVVPFNAHKQYNFDSNSATANKITFFNIEYNSGSIDTYLTGSGLSLIDNIKYNQINHLFYNDYNIDLSNKFGNINYLKHKRTLYNSAAIISIPVGLYGHKIKLNSLEFKMNDQTYIDDSYGNIINKNTNIDNFVTDPRSILLNIGPNDGFKKYNLNTNYETKVNNSPSYSTDSTYYEYDDSYFLNHIYYNKVNFSELNLTNQLNQIHNFPSITFDTESEIKVTHNDNLNFNENNNYSIEFWIDVKNDSSPPGEETLIHVLSKSTIQNTITGPSEYDGAPGEIQEINAGNQYPFKIYLQKIVDMTLLHFEVSDGDNINRCSTTLTRSANLTLPYHITCVREGSLIKIYRDASIMQSKKCTSNITNNKANIYIGGQSNITSKYNNNSFSGSLSNIKIYNQALNETQIQNHYTTKNASPYIGNIFYSHGLVVITHPKYHPNNINYGVGNMILDENDELLNDFTVNGSSTTGITNISFQGSHLIYENEYKCTIDEFEYNNTLNPTARKLRSSEDENMADFTTGSLFKPYITTIGLYNENHELLVIGKLGQPIRTSNETDTTIILRWDT